MTQLQTLPSPVAQWEEPPSSGAALALAGLVPYYTLDGAWVILGANVQPEAGAQRGVWLTDANGLTTPTLDTQLGQRLTAGPRGDLFAYGQLQVYRYVVGDSMGPGSFLRGGPANYDGESAEPYFFYGPGVAVTLVRGSAATYTGEA